MRVVELAYEIELVAEGLAHAVGNAVRIAILRVTLGGAGPGEMFEFFLWCAALGREFLRIIVTQLVQREATARGDLPRVDKRFRPGAEEVRHLDRKSTRLNSSH